MRPSLAIGLFVFLITASASPLFANPDPDYDKAIQQVSEWINGEVQRQNYVGLAVGFAHKDFVWTEGFGHANLELDVPMTASSVHRLASVSKPITAVGIMTLVQDGVISLDDDVRKYVPDFPEKRWPVTIRRVLGHQSGISHYKNFREEGHRIDRFTSEEALAIFKDWELLYEPGTDYSYTSYGFNLLAFAIEGATGQTFREYMTENIWLPLGMTHTRTDDIFDVIPDRVAGYEKVDGAIYNCRPVTTTMKFGGGGMVSTVGDLIKFARGLHTGSVLDANWVDTMWTPMVMTTGERSQYAMGWFMDNGSGFIEPWHTGGQAGTSTCLLHIPSLEFTAVVIGNLEGASPWAPAREMFEAVFGFSYTLPSLYSGTDPTADRMAHLEMLARTGSAYYDLTGQPLSENLDSLSMAFAAISEALQLDDDEKMNAFFDSAAHPYHGDQLLKAGTYIAARLEQAHGEMYFFDKIGQRRLRTILDYQTLAKTSNEIPEVLQFSDEVEAMVQSTLRDWQAVWTPQLAAIDLDHHALDSNFTNTLETAFDGKVVVPDFTRQIARRAEQAFEAGKVDEAIRLADLNTSLYPESHQAWLDRGFLAIAAEGNIEEGQMMIRNGLVFGGLPARGHAQVNERAYMLARMGKPAAGKAMLDVAVELYPQVANIKDSKAEMFLMIGDTTSAVTWYRKALESNPEFENAKRMLERLGATAAVDPAAGTN